MNDFLLKTSAQIVGQAIGLGLALAFLLWLAHHPTLLLIAEALTGLIVVAIVLGMIGAALYGVWRLLTWPWRVWQTRKAQEAALVQQARDQADQRAMQEMTTNAFLCCLAGAMAAQRRKRAITDNQLGAPAPLQLPGPNGSTP